jgi:uncharacterized protein
MKIFAFADLHCDYDLLKKIVLRVNQNDIDIVICCGDLSWFGSGLEECFELLSKINKTVLLISGNHDGNENIDSFCKKYSNCININHKKYVYKDHLFVGYSEGGFGNVDPRLKLLSKKFKDFFKEHKGKKVLVLHGPPHGTSCDDRSCWHPPGIHNGSITARNLIEQSSIDLVLCGHIHECENCMDKIGKTVILNPSKAGKVIEIK